jgi:hypothetical protein
MNASKPSFLPQSSRITQYMHLSLGRCAFFIQTAVSALFFRGIRAIGKLA